VTTSNDNGVPPSSGGWKPSASTVASRPAAAGGAVPPPSNVRVPSAPRDRKPALAALGLLLVLVGALASVYLQQQSKDRVGVVEITKTVPAGQVITAAEISEAMVAPDSNINYVTWAQAQGGALQGYTTRTDVEAGTLLVGQMLTTAAPLAPGQEVVGVALKDGQFPVGIQIGDTVSCYYVSNKNGDQTGQGFLNDGFTTPPIVANVRVYDVEQSGTNGDIDISLVLNQQNANAVAQAASGTNLVLVFDKHTQ
jgi:hypothetical protein